eukprot:m.488977 g.488977  ORF g.488977 m.488977 type:complete len:356 (+) comp26273_c0_seq1:404-1471(+)
MSKPPSVGNSENDRRDTVSSERRKPLASWLVKRGRHNTRSWKRRWCVASDEFVAYFKSPDAKKPIGHIPLAGATVREATFSQGEFGFEVVTDSRVWQLLAQSPTERRQWMAWIDHSLLHTSHPNVLMDQAEGIIEASLVGERGLTNQFRACGVDRRFSSMCNDSSSECSDDEQEESEGAAEDMGLGFLSLSPPSADGRQLGRWPSYPSSSSPPLSRSIALSSSHTDDAMLDASLLGLSLDGSELTTIDARNLSSSSVLSLWESESQSVLESFEGLSLDAHACVDDGSGQGSGKGWGQGPGGVDSGEVEADNGDVLGELPSLSTNSAPGRIRSHGKQSLLGKAIPNNVRKARNTVY